MKVTFNKLSDDTTEQWSQNPFNEVPKEFLPSLKTHPCNENRVFPVYFFSMKKLFPLAGIPVMKTGFSLLGKSTQGNPCSGPVLTL